MSRNIKTGIALFGLILLLGIAAVACVPSDLQQSIKDTQSQVNALKTQVDKLGGDPAKLDKVLGGDSDITQAERNITEHVVRGRADFIAFQENYNNFSKSASANLQTLVGTPASKTAAAKPGIAQNMDAKLDKLVGIPGKPAIPAKEDQKTGMTTPAKAAVPAIPGLIDGVNAKLDKLVGIPGQLAVAAKLDKAGKVTTPAKAVVPAIPGAIDDVVTQLKDMNLRLDRIEKALATAPFTAK